MYRAVPFLAGGFRRLRAATYFAHGGKVGKTPPGTAPDEHFVLIFAFPRTPFTGVTPLVRQNISGAQNLSGGLRFLPGHWALGLQKFRLVRSRWCAWLYRANAPGTNPGGPVWDRPLREQRGHSHIRRRGGSKTRPKAFPLPGGRWHGVAVTDEGDLLPCTTPAGGPRASPTQTMRGILKLRRGGDDSPYQGEMSSAARQRG